MWCSLTLMMSRQGIAHVVGPEQGLTLPGMTVVCGDSIRQHMVHLAV